MIVALLAYIAIGVVSGIIGGLLGIGGGAIVVPSLLFVFSFLDFSADTSIRLAIGTSLASMVINTFSSMYYHKKKDSISRTTVKKILPGIVIGSILGAVITKYLSGVFLVRFFGLFILLIGFYLAKPIKTEITTHKLPKTAIFNLIGIGVSSISCILGIGGGVFLFPLLSFYGFDARKSIATSVTISFFIALFGVLGYLEAGSIPMKWCIGYIYLPAFFIIGVSSFFSAAYGAKLSHSLKQTTLRKVFSASLIIIGITMIFK